MTLIEARERRECRPRPLLALRRHHGNAPTSRGSLCHAPHRPQWRLVRRSGLEWAVSASAKRYATDRPAGFDRMGSVKTSDRFF